MIHTSLSERDMNAIWHPYTQHLDMQPAIPIVRGSGALLYDEHGNSFIDAVSSWWVNLHGHAHPYIAEKIYEQALKLEQVIFTRFTHEPAVNLAEKLLAILPGSPSRIFYSDNGSTAVEVALKMALQFWKNQGKAKRNKILAFENAYHGDTFGAMSVSGRGLFTAAFADKLFDVVFIETPNAGNIDKIKNIINAYEEQLAGFIYEPLLQAAGGMLMYKAEDMNSLLDFIHSKEIICIADEVMTGFGRTGQLFASLSFRIPPDIVCMSKGLTGGTMALGATSCNRKIFDAFLSKDSEKTLFHGHSFTANPIACAAALASLEILQDVKTQEQIRFIQQQHEIFAGKILKFKQPIFRNIRVTGTVLAFELNTGNDSYTNHIGNRIMKLGLDRGIYIRPLGNTVYLMPPYCITRADLDKLYLFLQSIPELLTTN
jgi:adenosylmethionine---8-amino-7-oxononanoate aminotransferase